MFLVCSRSVYSISLGGGFGKVTGFGRTGAGELTGVVLYSRGEETVEEGGVGR